MCYIMLYFFVIYEWWYIIFYDDVLLIILLFRLFMTWCVMNDNIMWIWMNFKICIDCMYWSVWWLYILNDEWDMMEYIVNDLWS